MDLTSHRLWFETLRVELLDPKHQTYPENATLASQLLYARSADTFEEWWELVGEDFEPLEPYLARVIESPEEAERWSLWHADLADLNEVVLLVQLDEPRTKVLNEVKRLMHELKKPVQGKTKVKPTANPLAGKVDAVMIERLLRIYKHRVAGLKLWEIAAEEKLCKGPNGSAFGRSASPDEREQMKEVASRQLKFAVDLVKNAHLGIFPKYSRRTTSK